MVETTSDGTSGSGTTSGSSGSSSSGIVDFLTSRVGMALAGGVVITLIIGYMVFF